MEIYLVHDQYLSYAMERARKSPHELLNTATADDIIKRKLICFLRKGDCFKDVSFP